MTDSPVSVAEKKKTLKLCVGPATTKPLVLPEVATFESLCDSLFENDNDNAVNVTLTELVCPRCDVGLEEGGEKVEKEDGDTFSYWRCPREMNGVKCFVTHAADGTCGDYLQLVDAQLAPCYRPTGNIITDHKRRLIPFINMECYCCLPLVLLQSKSERNPDRLFFKCRKGGCRFFQWADSVPRNNAWKWLQMRVGPEEKLAQAKPPPDLQKPGSKRPREATPRATPQSKQAKVVSDGI